MIHPATVADVPAIARLINTYAERGLMLHRSHGELYETLRDFVIYTPDMAQDVPPTNPSIQHSEFSIQPLPHLSPPPSWVSVPWKSSGPIWPKCVHWLSIPHFKGAASADNSSQP